MLFSIIIPAYNRAQVVRRTLDTVLAQNYRPLQLVLVDNASTDGTLAVLEDFKRAHHNDDFNVVVTQEQRHTAGAARNRGLQHATGDWLMFFDSDDEMLPGLVQAYAHQVQRHCGQIDLISARSMLAFPDGTRREAPFFTRDIFANHILHGQLATQRYAVRHEFFTANGGWNSDLPGWNDWELGIRLLLAQPRVALMTEGPLVIVNHSRQDSITGTEFHTRAGQWERAIDIACEHVQRASLPHKERYGRLLDYRRLVLAAQYQREEHPELAQPLMQRAFGALRDSYGDSRRWRYWVRPMTRWFMSRIVDGKRGSARIARRLF